MASPSDCEEAGYPAGDQVMIGERSSIGVQRRDDRRVGNVETAAQEPVELHGAMRPAGDQARPRRHLIECTAMPDEAACSAHGEQAFGFEIAIGMVAGVQVAADENRKGGKAVSTVSISSRICRSR